MEVNENVKTNKAVCSGRGKEKWHVRRPERSWFGQLWFDIIPSIQGDENNI
jgi:hypothetical protein